MHESSRRAFLHRAGMLAGHAIAIRYALPGPLRTPADVRMHQAAVTSADPVVAMRAQMGAAPIHAALRAVPASSGSLPRSIPPQTMP